MRVKFLEKISETAKLVIVSIFVIILFVSTIILAENLPKEYLKISFLNVGQGDSILVQTPRGGKILIDGGRDKTVLSKLGEELPIGTKSFELVIATHDDSDHIAGLIDVLKKYNVKVLLVSLPNSESTLSKELLKVAQEKNTKIVHVKKPMYIKTDDGLQIKILFPVKNMDSEFFGDNSSDGNDASIVTQLVFGKTKILLTGDLGIMGEKFLIERYGHILESNILKLGHHGSDTSSSPEFLQIVKPEVAIVSAGKNNSFGHPHRSVLELLEKFQIVVLRTDELGTINLYSNGLNVWRE